MKTSGSNFKVHVTAEDIIKGVPDSCRFCPIARATERALPGSHPEVSFYDIEDTRGYISIGKYSDDDVELEEFEDFILPKKAVAFIELFDGSKGTSPDLKPFSFTAKLMTSPFKDDDLQQRNLLIGK